MSENGDLYRKTRWSMIILQPFLCLHLFLNHAYLKIDKWTINKLIRRQGNLYF